jgi:hypothetical protein
MQWAFKNGRSSKLRFNFQKSVVLRYPSAPASRSAFNLASAHGYCKIGNKGVFCFSQTVRDDKSPAGFPAELDRLNGFGYRTDLVQFDEYGIRRFFRYAARNQLGIGYIDIIADDLNTRPQRGCMLAKPIPIAFRQTVFNGNDVIFLDPGFVKGRHLGAGFRALVGFGEIVDSVFIERTGGWIQRDGDIVARLIPGNLDSLDDHLACFIITLQVGREAPFVSHRGGISLLLEEFLQSMKNLCAVTKPLGETGGADRHHHKLLQIDAVVGMLAAVQYVHHRHGYSDGARAAEIRIERKIGRHRCRTRRSHRDSENGICSQPGFIESSVQINHGLVYFRLAAGIHPDNLGSDCRIHIGYGLQDALAVVAFFVIIAQFTGFIFAGGRTRWHGCACGYAVIQCYKSAQGGIAARVQYFHCSNRFNFQIHESSSISAGLAKARGALPGLLRRYSPSKRFNF